MLLRSELAFILLISFFQINNADHLPSYSNISSRSLLNSTETSHDPADWKSSLMAEEDYDYVFRSKLKLPETHTYCYFCKGYNKNCTNTQKKIVCDFIRDDHCYTMQQTDGTNQIISKGCSHSRYCRFVRRVGIGIIHMKYCKQCQTGNCNNETLDVADENVARKLCSASPLVWLAIITILLLA